MGSESTKHDLVKDQDEDQIRSMLSFCQQSSFQKIISHIMLAPFEICDVHKILKLQKEDKLK